MLSFIIIGKNEEKYLGKCLESINETIAQNHLEDAEIIYVDSASNDNCLKLATAFSGVKCLLITGKCSVAVGRNAGASEAAGDFLFFIDADCEINPGFLAEVILNKDQFCADIITGIVMNHYHDETGRFIWKEPNRNIQKDFRDPLPGGIFIIKKEILEKEGLMDTRFVNAFEDYDFGLKAASKGHFTLLKNTLIANHFTENKKDYKKLFYDIFSGKELFRGVLYRKHLLNRLLYPVMLKNDSTAIILLIVCIFILISGWFELISFYLLALLFRVFLQKKRQLYEILYRFPLLFTRDIGTILAFLFYYPRKTKVEYQVISR